MIDLLEPYPTMKDSRVAYLGQVPKHWVIRTIKTLFIEKDERNRSEQGILLSFTRTHGIVRHQDIATRMPSASDLSHYKVCMPGDLVMNRMQAWSGRFAVSPTGGLVSPDYSVFVTKSAADTCAKFFEYLFRTPSD